MSPSWFGWRSFQQSEHLSCWPPSNYFVFAERNPTTIPTTNSKVPKSGTQMKKDFTPPISLVSLQTRCVLSLLVRDTAMGSDSCTLILPEIYFICDSLAKGHLWVRGSFSSPEQDVTLLFLPNTWEVRWSRQRAHRYVTAPLKFLARNEVGWEDIRNKVVAPWTGPIRKLKKCKRPRWVSTLSFTIWHNSIRCSCRIVAFRRRRQQPTDQRKQK